MISIFPHKNLQPIDFAFNFSKSVAINHAENTVTPNLHNNIGAANKVANQYFQTCYTEGGIFNESTAMIYSDSYGTPLSRGAVQNWNYNSHGLTAASGHYHMNIIGGENIFNTPVLANSIEKLPYIIPCYLHREHVSAAGPYGYQGITYLSYLRLTYVSVFSDNLTMNMATKLSLNEFNGISLSDPSANWFNWGQSGSKMWLTPVYQGFTSSYNNDTNNMHSHKINYNEDRVYSTVYNPTMKWVVPRTYGPVTTPGTGTHIRAANVYGGSSPIAPTPYPAIPQAQKELLYQGNGSSPSYPGTAGWYFQDNMSMFGHTNWEAGSHMAGGSLGGNSYWLTKKSPIFMSSTPNAYGGNNQNNTVFPQSGWYCRAPSGGNTYYWNKRIYMFTLTKTD